MAIPTEYIPIIGPITAATLAGAVAYIVSVLSKEQKTSEFRQAWIDGLRSDIAELLAHCTSMALLLSNRRILDHGRDEMNAYVLSKEEEQIKINLLNNRIMLRLNPKEHKALIGCLTSFEIIDWEEEDLVKTFDNLAAVAIVESQKVLKREWNRVKRGEPVFRCTKWAALVISIAAIAFFFIIVL